MRELKSKQFYDDFFAGKELKLYKFSKDVFGQPNWSEKCTLSDINICIEKLQKGDLPQEVALDLISHIATYFERTDNGVDIDLRWQLFQSLDALKTLLEIEFKSNKKQSRLDIRKRDKDIAEFIDFMVCHGAPKGELTTVLSNWLGIGMDTLDSIKKRHCKVKKNGNSLTGNTNFYEVNFMTADFFLNFTNNQLRNFPDDNEEIYKIYSKLYNQMLECDNRTNQILNNEA